MIYSEKSNHGQEILEAKMVKEGNIRYVRPDGVYERPNSAKKERNVVILEACGVPETPDDYLFGVAVMVADNDVRILRTKFKTAAEAKAAAKVLAIVSYDQWAAAVRINKDVPDSYTRESDPERYDRDHLEDDPEAAYMEAHGQ